MTKHSELPWSVDESCVIFALAPDGTWEKIGLFSPIGDQPRANCELVVRAVNNYHKLLAALKQSEPTPALVAP